MLPGPIAGVKRRIYNIPSLEKKGIKGRNHLLDSINLRPYIYILRLTPCYGTRQVVIRHQEGAQADPCYGAQTNENPHTHKTTERLKHRLSKARISVGICLLARSLKESFLLDHPVKALESDIIHPSNAQPSALNRPSRLLTGVALCERVQRLTPASGYRRPKANSYQLSFFLLELRDPLVW